MTVLPSAYLGSVEYFAHLCLEECVVDSHEHFIKRSMRNRASILSANGVMELTVNVRNANRPHTPLCDVKIDYSKRWQHQHWVSIVSAYKSSAYFDYYRDRFEPFYTKEYKYLIDYNNEITALILQLLGFPDRLVTSGEYVPPQDGVADLRPKKKESSAFCAEPYFQVFSDRMPFMPNLSVIDLLFAEGPESVSVLKRCCL